MTTAARAAPRGRRLSSLAVRARASPGGAYSSRRPGAAGGFTTTPDNPFESRRAPMTLEELQERAEKLPALLQEIVQIMLSTGPSGVQRGVQAAQAVMAVGADVLSTSRTRGAPETYIKLGQFIASSPTLFPEEYVLEFQKCLDKTDPVPFTTIERIIKAELKEPLSSVFISIDPTPLASASVAQVHAATLAGSNQQVVVKVLKPGVEDVLKTDLSFIYIATKVLEFINPDLARTSLSAIVGDVRQSMLEEVDFVTEARHIQEFSLYLDNSGARRFATCPYVYKQYTSKRLLTMERLNGVPLT
eukprot:CAMPEP_0177786986 /NCGR_PEP_ID=MMETSP0491_2-20121128/21224_1 /TAXON_ID=63592 /ORGANISM="Tetraselmis chuii, Strain PLY429" /LENGTH=302 /DNA_ID=CAMNT_0019308251 /DNA_START=170 /DNA_END=1074 /DNA_ORIENTATION=+